MRYLETAVIIAFGIVTARIVYKLVVKKSAA